MADALRNDTATAAASAPTLSTDAVSQAPGLVQTPAQDTAWRPIAASGVCCHFAPWGACASCRIVGDSDPRHRMHVHISRHVQSLAFNGPNATPEQWLRLRDLLDRAVDAGLADPSALRFMVGHVQEGSFSPEYYFDLWEGRLAARLSQPASQPTANASQQTVRRSAARWHGAVLTAIERLRVGEIDASPRA